MAEEKVDWNEQPLQRWLGTITKPGTRYSCRSAWRVYVKYTNMIATQLIDEALEEIIG